MKINTDNYHFIGMAFLSSQWAKNRQEYVKLWAAKIDKTIGEAYTRTVKVADGFCCKIAEYRL